VSKPFGKANNGGASPLPTQGNDNMKFCIAIIVFLVLWLLACYGQFAFWMDETGIGFVFYGFGGGVFETPYMAQ
jgi:hypothetical protein